MAAVIESDGKDVGRIQRGKKTSDAGRLPGDFKFAEQVAPDDSGLFRSIRIDASQTDFSLFG